MHVTDLSVERVIDLSVEHVEVSIRVNSIAA